MIGLSLMALAALVWVALPVFVLWRWGLFTRDPFRAVRQASLQAAEAQAQARDEIARARAQGLHPSQGAQQEMTPEEAAAFQARWAQDHAPARPVVRRPGRRFGTRAGLGGQLAATVHQEATAVLEAQALEDGALERAVLAWMGDQGPQSAI